MPAAKKDDIHVAIDGSQASITVEVKRETEERKDDKVLCSERFFERLHRSLSLPTAVDQSTAEAKYSDGVLELTLPKKPGAAAKRLEICWVATTARAAAAEQRDLHLR